MKIGLLLIDLQNDYFRGGRMELVGMAAAAARAGELLAAFRRQDLPTFHLQHLANWPDAPFFRTGTAGAAIHESVRPLAGETVMVKHFPNSFRETDLLEKLKGAGLEEVVICGAMSHMCIDATTRAAADYGFKCLVVPDACATRDLTFGEVKVPASQVHAAFMAALESYYARVVYIEDLLRGF
jgi:nicotinamidase-related amidase